MSPPSSPLDSNNNLKIYLGNNGLYTLEGKELHLSFGWNDSGNQDGACGPPRRSS